MQDFAVLVILRRHFPTEYTLQDSRKNVPTFNQATVRLSSLSLCFTKQNCSDKLYRPSLNEDAICRCYRSHANCASLLRDEFAKPRRILRERFFPLGEIRRSPRYVTLHHTTPRNYWGVFKAVKSANNSHETI